MRACESRLTSAEVWIEMISSVRRFRSSSSRGMNGAGSIGRRSGEPACLGSSTSTILHAMGGNACSESPKLVVRSRSRRRCSTSMSATSSSPSGAKRRDSASIAPSSATIAWPPKTTSCVDSPVPHEA